MINIIQELSPFMLMNASPAPPAQTHPLPYQPPAQTHQPPKPSNRPPYQPSVQTHQPPAQTHQPPYQPPVQTHPQQPKHPQPKQKCPQIKDTLLDCLVKLHEPFANTIEPQLFTNTFNEQLFKISFIDKLRDPTNKQRLWARENRVAMLPMVEANITTDTTINLASFLTICKLEYVAPFNIIYKNAFYQFTPDDIDDAPDDNIRCIIYDSTIHKWIVDKSHNTTPLYEITNINKPYKAVSAYTVAELRAICEKLNITVDATSKPTKPQLYELIKTYFQDLMRYLS